MMKKLRFVRITRTLLALSIFAAATGAHAQTFSVLYNFGTHAGDPLQPAYEGVIAQGRDGTLYSTTPLGGANSLGTVFKITTSGILTVLHSFTGGSDGDNPNSGLTLGTDGNFYGTSSDNTTSGYGSVFKITPRGTLTTLHKFTGGIDGAYPFSPPIRGTDGNFYGTTQGGVGGGAQGYGTVYRMTHSGALTTLYHFDSTHGANPNAPLIQGTDGNFYGTTITGGTCGCGVVFKITPSGKLTVLHNFDITNGSQPLSPLIQGADSDFYGTTTGGGNNGCGGGVIFKITLAGDFHCPPQHRWVYRGR